VNPAELGEEIAVELEALEETVNELLALQRDVANREATVWTGAAWTQALPASRMCFPR
jgi:hypothetical protein